MRQTYSTRAVRHVATGIALVGAMAAVALMPGSASAQERPASAQPAKVDFAMQVLPIFKRRCFACHGPDEHKSNFRLDSRIAALAGGDTGEPAIVPGKSADSPLIAAVLQTGDLKMPPEGDKLSPADVDLLRQWIDAGAIWPESANAEAQAREHWGFQPVIRPPVPAASEDGFVVRNPIDAFMLAKLHEANLQPSAEADRRTLCRRVYFDVIGLPPTWAEVQSFVADPDPAAYEKLVDRLLGSPRYGERWARHWLDVVRFAESDGFETNQPRPNAWPYRDYVIRALNDDKPYDQFIVEQLAGDQSGADEATAFIVGGAVDRVKSPDPVLTAQQRADELHDMVSTTGSAFLGLTVGCARCHTHKFDPIPQTDYYALKACFAGVQHAERPMRKPEDAERTRQLAALQPQLDAVSARLLELEPLASTHKLLLLDDDLAAQPDAGGPTAQELKPPRGVAPHVAGTARGQANDPGSATRLPDLGASYRWWEGPIDQDVFAWRPRTAGHYRLWISWGCGWNTHAHAAQYVLDADGDLATRGDRKTICTVDQRYFADGTGELPSQPLWSGFRRAGTVDLTSQSSIVLHSDDTGQPVTADVILLEEVDGRDSGHEPASEFPALRSPPTSRLNVERFAPITAQYVRLTVHETNQFEPCIDELEVFTVGPNSRNVALSSAGGVPSSSSNFPGAAIHQLAHVNDGLYGNEHSWISNEPGRGWVEIKFAKPETIDRVTWSRDRTPQPKYADRTATRYDVAVSTDGKSWQTVAGSADRLPASYAKKVTGALPGHLSAAEQSERATLEAQRLKLAAEVARLSASAMVYAGQFTQPDAVFRLQRGDPMQPREPVAPGSLTKFGPTMQLPTDATEPARRMALGKSIASPANPLTARVMANRLWQHHFGTGIVATPSDFGLNGAKPSHRELLDWLAAELVAPSGAQPWSLKHLHRLMLLSSTYRQSSAANEAGLRIDGQSRLLWRYPPARLEAEAVRDAILAVSGKLDLTMGGPGFDLFEPNTNYVKVYNSARVFGPETWRRMIYQAKPRMQLDDTFGAFDCPDAGQIAPRRNSSTTPLQALNLLNSPFIQQQATFFAERLARQAGNSPSAQARLGFQTALAREPSAEEQQVAERLIAEQGLPIFCRALLNAAEFVRVY